MRISDLGDGLPLVWLELAEPAVAALAACRVATLTLPGPTYASTVRLVVSLRMRRPDETGRRAYDPTLLSVRLDDAAGTVTVPVDEFLRVAPDAARLRRRTLLDHLDAEHADDLVDAVRATGLRCDLALVAPGRGLEIVVSHLGAEGAGQVSLAYDEQPGDLTLTSICGCHELG